MPLLRGVRLVDRLGCQGIPLFAKMLEAPLLQAAGDVRDVDIGQQERLTFAFLQGGDDGGLHSWLSSLHAGYIAQVRWDDESYDEWRLANVEQGKGNGGLVKCECTALIQDLAGRPGTASGKGYISLVVNARRTYQFSVANRTPTSALNAFLFGAEDIPRSVPTWITLGTVDPTIKVNFNFERSTPLQFLFQLRDAIRARGVLCEVQLRRNGTTDYKLDLLTEIGASADIPLFHPDGTLESLIVVEDVESQITRCFVRGQADPDGALGFLGRARWLGTAPSSNWITLTDPAGGSSPIAFDDQLVGAYLLHCRSGMTFLIDDSEAAAGRVHIVGSVLATQAANDFYEFRLTEPLSNTLRWGMNTTPECGVTTISGVAGSVLTLNQYFSGYPLQSGDIAKPRVGWSVRRATYVGSWNLTSVQVTSPASPTTPRLNITGTSPVGTVQVGDIIVNAQTAGNRPISTYGIFVVTGVAATYFDCTLRDLVSVGGTNYGGGESAYVYRPVTTLHRITDCDPASPNTLTVDAVGTAAIDDLIELLQRDGAGEMPDYLEHPLYVQDPPTGSGPKIGEIVRETDFGIVQLATNPICSAWSNPANPPDGWSKTGTGTISRETDPVLEPSAYSFGFNCTTGNTLLISAPPIYVNPGAGINWLSARLTLYFSTYTGTDLTSALQLFTNSTRGGASAALTSKDIQPTDGAGAQEKIAVGQIVTIAIEQIEIKDELGTFDTIIAKFDPIVGGSGSAIGVILGLEVYPFRHLPDQQFEYGDATRMHQVANIRLAEVGPRPMIYRLGAVDLARGNSDYDRTATTIGGRVHCVVPAYGHDVSKRLLHWERNLLVPEESQFTLGNRDPLLTTGLKTNFSREVVKVLEEQAIAQGQAIGAVAGQSSITPVPVVTGFNPIVYTRQISLSLPMGTNVWLVQVEVLSGGSRIELWQYVVFGATAYDPGRNYPGILLWSLGGIV